MTFLENRVPPPLVLLISLILIRLVATADNILILPFHARAIGAGVFLVSGILLALSGVSLFQKAQTTINPLDPDAASRLITTGVYQYTRNPMYLGMLLVSIAASIYFSSVVSLLVVAGFYLFITRFQIVPEERALLNLFKDAFEEYRKQVRRWL
ncbi:MAG: isoprenylcysteine carboxylmethyltransferase family protein [Gammaproteobacteria bacterium]|nr:isoprenylcysteine carboxylmethyltransferase family protein [Gammaproteobacteria bacterium]